MSGTFGEEEREEGERGCYMEMGLLEDRRLQSRYLAATKAPSVVWILKPFSRDSSGILVMATRRGTRVEGWGIQQATKTTVTVTSMVTVTVVVIIPRVMGAAVLLVLVRVPVILMVMGEGEVGVEGVGLIG